MPEYTRLLLQEVDVLMSWKAGMLGKASRCKHSDNQRSARNGMIIVRIEEMDHIRYSKPLIDNP